jgi:hypothetical protein
VIDRSDPSPVADSGAPADPPPLPATPSHFDVPLEYDFSPVLGAVERVVPSTFGSLDSVRAVKGDGRRHYAFEATRGPFTAFIEDSLVHLRARLSYAARGFYKPPLGPTLSASCGSRTNTEERPRIDVEVVTSLGIDSTWHLTSHAQLARLEAASATTGDRCRVSIVKFDVTERVVEAARRAVGARMPHIDRKIGEMDLSDRAAGWWAQLEQPIRLAEGVWLELRPERLRVGRVGGAGRMLVVRAGLDASPRVVVGEQPAVVSRPLPPLARDTTAGGFRVLVDGHVDWATASRTITEALRGRTISKAGQTVTVTSVEATPRARGMVALNVTFTGDATGTMRLLGTPRLDTARAMVVVPDLDYDLATDNELVNVVAWVKDDALRALLRERARVPLTPVLERGRALLTQGLNRTIGRAMTLSARVDSVTVDGLFVTRDGLLVRTGATGTARVAVRQPPPDQPR